MFWKTGHIQLTRDGGREASKAEGSGDDGTGELHGDDNGLRLLDVV